MCYKQKCKVVSLNLAHPVRLILLASLANYKLDLQIELEVIAF